MAITSYFYDSVGGDRPYSAQAFAKAFDIVFETGVLIREAVGGTLGFDIGGTNFNTVYEGKAVIEGHFVEVTGTETLTVPAGNYNGQVVIQMDFDDVRDAKLVVKQDRTPIQSTSFYELPLYDCTVANNIITTVTDKRYQGGAVPNNHNQPMSTIDGLETELNTKIEWKQYADGGYLECGLSSGGKTFRIYLTSTQPWDGDANDRHVWIQTDA